MTTRKSPSKLPFYIFSATAALLILFEISYTSLTPPPPAPSPLPSSSPPTFLQRWQQRTLMSHHLDSMIEKLRLSVTFLPLKDLRYANKALEGHTWFMSSLYDIRPEGDLQHQEFPSEASQGRLLCLKGNDTRDGARNHYAIAWPEALPVNATLMKGLTFVAYNHYDYYNIWHSLEAFFPFVAWHLRNGYESPERWVLFQKGELRYYTNPYVSTLMGATFGKEPFIETFSWASDEQPICFEKAVVMRHCQGGMSKEKRIETYALIRQKARAYCNVSIERRASPEIRMTLLMRDGARSFKNDTAVIEIFQSECKKVEGCQLLIARSNNLTICDQVELMSYTDILVSPHGAQLTNLFLMNINSSVMEFYPKGWLKLAGIGQYVYKWMASWSGMKHEGSWRDPDGEHCSNPEDGRQCTFKTGRIGHNETYFSEWASSVLKQVKTRKLEETSSSSPSISS